MARPRTKKTSDPAAGWRLRAIRSRSKLQSGIHMKHLRFALFFILAGMVVFAQRGGGGHAGGGGGHAVGGGGHMGGGGMSGGMSRAPMGGSFGGASRGT